MIFNSSKHFTGTFHMYDLYVGIVDFQSSGTADKHDMRPLACGFTGNCISHLACREVADIPYRVYALAGGSCCYQNTLSGEQSFS